jgi:hypothetical protein
MWQHSVFFLLLFAQELKERISLVKSPSSNSFASVGSSSAGSSLSSAISQELQRRSQVKEIKLFSNIPSNYVASRIKNRMCCVTGLSLSVVPRKKKIYFPPQCSQWWSIHFNCVSQANTLENKTKLWEEVQSTFLDMTWTTQKTTCPTIFLLLCVYMLPQ